jgi:hypothetical protein
MAYEKHDGLFIAEDGSYGGGPIIIVDHDAFTDEQMDVLASLNDNDRFDYVEALLNGKDVSKWEDQVF